MGVSVLGLPSYRADSERVEGRPYLAEIASAGAGGEGHRVPNGGGDAPRSAVDYLLGAGELPHNALAKGRQVVGRSAGREVSIRDDRFVEHLGAGVAQVGAQAREGRQPPSAYHAGLDQ